MPRPMPAPAATASSRGKSGRKASHSAAITDSPQFMCASPCLPLNSLAAAATADTLTPSFM